MSSTKTYTLWAKYSNESKNLIISLDDDDDVNICDTIQIKSGHIDYKLLDNGKMVYQLSKLCIQIPYSIWYIQECNSRECNTDVKEQVIQEEMPVQAFVKKMLEPETIVIDI